MSSFLSLYVLVSLVFSLSLRAKTSFHFISPAGGKIERDKSHQDGLSEEEYREAIRRVKKIYSQSLLEQDIFLKIERLWDDDYVNSGTYKERVSQNNYLKYKLIILAYGGLARVKNMNLDSFVLVLCHELGHHLGGKPYSTDHLGKVLDFATEGQADYWASHSCFKEYAKEYPRELSPEEEAKAVSKTCQAAFLNERDQKICLRGALAGENLAALFAQLHGESHSPRLGAYSKLKVPYNINSYPDSQCRLDTYLRGALCQKNEVTILDPRATSNLQCINSESSRPSCWHSL